MTLLPPVRRPAPAGEPRSTVPFLGDLARHGEAPALVAEGAVLTFSDLAARVERAVTALDRAGTRRLVLLEAGNDLDPIVTYLACLHARHPVLLVPPTATGAAPPWRHLVDTYDPDVVVARDAVAGTWTVDERHRRTPHDLHPDLALLLSTSGSTGAPKLVRLSHENLRSNAAAIASYLGLGADDRAITSLPMGYCYGLSVLHSHLATGASIVLSDRSVIDDEFWRTFTRHGATSFAGVPHTFELLDRIGFADLHLPTLRRVTQAGGRLDPEVVRRYAALGRRRGWDLFVMYGQTEATARMAYLPPDLAEEHPAAVGVPVPGGALRLEDVDAAGVGELVYRGPNVMLGYAEAPHHLALGRTLEELRTGDLARVDGNGLFEVVGRRARFVKPFGLRIDLDELERTLRRDGIEALCAGDDRRVVVATAPADVERATATLDARLGLPTSARHVQGVAELPRLPSGKPDHAAVLALAGPATAPHRAPADSVRRLYADVLGRADVRDHDTFTSLGGDSLSYVELSVRLEETIGALPDEWPSMPLVDLERLRPARDRRGGAPAPTRTAAVETTVVLRATAIVLIVATHTALVDLKGGAHLLLAVAGWNFARFQLPVAGRRLAASIGRVALPTMAWLALLLLLTDAYDLTNLALVHTQVGTATWDERWRFWFIETLVQALALAGAVAAVPPVRRLERRYPFGFALGALGAALVLREASAQDGTVRRPQEVLWFFVLGWAIQRARTTPQKLLVTGVTAVAVHGFFGQPLREALVVAGITALVWVRSVPIVRPLHRGVAAVASASLAVYLTHWHVYPPVRAWSSPAVALVASLAVGLAVHAAAHRAAAVVRRS